MNVKTWVKVTVGIMLSFMIVFTSIGYAEITTNLEVKGSVNVSPPLGLFITDITLKSDSMENIDHYSVSYIPFTTTVEAVIDKRMTNVDGTEEDMRPLLTRVRSRLK